MAADLRQRFETLVSVSSSEGAGSFCTLLVCVERAIQRSADRSEGEQSAADSHTKYVGGVGVGEVLGGRDGNTETSLHNRDKRFGELTPRDNLQSTSLMLRGWCYVLILTTCTEQCHTTRGVSYETTRSTGR
mmetsp:Transcript_32432/g.76171  ORF Transcript_32432/g.76171 Transcript_32432/m.76171 type:complete len:132 (-) Transcript_32432:192-587(-)